MTRLIVSTVLLLILAGCAHRTSDMTDDSAAPQARADGGPALFSPSPPGALPAGWDPFIILRTKKPTAYRLVPDQGRSVLHARAERSSSGLMHQVAIDPLQQPWLNWRWKISSVIEGADNFNRATEDSPARIILAFNGDRDALPFADQMMFETVRLLTGREVPYATLMYIWENKAPIGTVIANSRSGRLQKMVAASGTEGVGQWHEFTRNIVEDYEKAFGEKPGELIGVGVLTDTDNTGEMVEAWYGDIRLLRERP